MKILILCTGNSCRSQMAEGFLKSLDNNLEVHSAGTKPSGSVHKKAIKVMSEIGINIQDGFPKNVNEFINDPFDYVITVCGGAKESCPAFIGNVKNHLHIGFDDPADEVGSEEEILSVFRRIRNEIKTDFLKFYNEKIK